MQVRPSHIALAIVVFFVFGLVFYITQRDGAGSIENDSTLTTAFEKVLPSQNSAVTSSAAPMPENDYLISARTGIFKGYLRKKELSRDEIRGFLPKGETLTCDVFVITEGDMSMFYEWPREGGMATLSEEDLPYELYIGNGDIRTLPETTQEVLLDSSASRQVYAAITEYVTTIGKDRDTCETTIEYFAAFNPA